VAGALAVNSDRATPCAQPFGQRHYLLENHRSTGHGGTGVALTQRLGRCLRIRNSPPVPSTGTGAAREIGSPAFGTLSAAATCRSGLSNA
jgi:hypothetical protein